MATNIAEPAAGASLASAHLQLEDRIWLLRAMLLMRLGAVHVMPSAEVLKTRSLVLQPVRKRQSDQTT